MWPPSDGPAPEEPPPPLDDELKVGPRLPLNEQAAVTDSAKITHCFMLRTYLDPGRVVRLRDWGLISTGRPGLGTLGPWTRA
jgi:hypothetical protein